MRLVKLISEFIFLGVICFYSQLCLAQKNILTPFQINLQACVDTKIDVKKIDSSKKLYSVIEQFYALATSETLYREVIYTLKGEQKKMKYENGLIQIFSVVDDDDTFALMSTEKYGTEKVDNPLRYKVRSVEARINQLLFRADIKSDYQKIKETRAKQVDLNVTWSDGQIKSLNIEFLATKKTLNCVQKDLTDICTCQN